MEVLKQIFRSHINLIFPSVTEITVEAGVQVTDLQTLQEGRDYRLAYSEQNQDGSTTVHVPTGATVEFQADGKTIRDEDFRRQYAHNGGTNLTIAGQKMRAQTTRDEPVTYRVTGVPTLTVLYRGSRAGLNERFPRIPDAPPTGRPKR